MVKTDLILVTIIVISTGLSIIWVSDVLSDKHWEKNSHLLTWDDFRGVPDYTALSSGAAIKADLKHQTSYESKITQGSCHYWFTKVKGIAYMSKMESWVKPDQKYFWTLQHEQIHFDIVQIHAKKFNQRVENELLNQKFLCPVGSDSWFESKIKTAAYAKVTVILNQAREEIGFMQKAYDEQTRHGMNNEQQKRWEYMVRDMLGN